MQSEPAVAPWHVESASELTPAERPYLRLVSPNAESADEERTDTPVLVMRMAEPRGDDIASPPLAEPVESAAAGLWASPADLLGLLTAASEHRRVVDLIWSASQIGALQLPPTLVAALERARASWPQALPVSC
jgi:hypothetical protein